MVHPGVVYSAQPGQLYVTNSTLLVPILRYCRLILGAGDTVMRKKKSLLYGAYIPGEEEMNLYINQHIDFR